MAPARRETWALAAASFCLVIILGIVPFTTLYVTAKTNQILGPIQRTDAIVCAFVKSVTPAAHIPNPLKEDLIAAAKTCPAIPKAKR